MLKKSFITLFVILGIVFITGCSKSECQKGDIVMDMVDNTGDKPFEKVATPVNADFYNEDGSLNSEKAKEVYFALMRAFHHPIPEKLQNEFWSADFLTGEFAKLGMGGIFWMNEKGAYNSAGAGDYTGVYQDEQFGYLGHDIYLLPGQTLPEHRHMGGLEGLPPKMEAWKVTNGSITFFGEYNLNGERPIEELAVEDRPFGYGEEWFKSKYYVIKNAGEVYIMDNPESWHGQIAGPDGAIVMESATYHNGVEFSGPGMLFASSEAKK